MSVAELAAREGIPEHFLSVILSDLRQRGIVRGRRGPDGGYQLDVDPRALNLADLVESLGGPLFPFACLLRGADGARCSECPGAERCAAARALGRASAAAYEVLESIAIADLASESAPEPNAADAAQPARRAPSQSSPERAAGSRPRGNRT
jgi:Rrf2 family protein